MNKYILNNDLWNVYILYFLNLLHFIVQKLL